MVVNCMRRGFLAADWQAVADAAAAAAGSVDAAADDKEGAPGLVETDAADVAVAAADTPTVMQASLVSSSSRCRSVLSTLSLLAVSSAWRQTSINTATLKTPGSSCLLRPESIS